MPHGTVRELWRYPVKSMAGERLEALRVDWRGAGGDRTHALHFEHKGALRRLTVREAPAMLHWRAAYGPADVEPAEPPLATLTAPGGEAYGWADPALPEALARDLGRAVTLRRDLDGQQDLGRSLLLTTEASRRALEAELGAPVDLRRFRPNLHLDLDAPAWAEERGWEGGTVELEGGVVLRLLHPCERCVIPTRDPDTAEKWPALLRHLVREHATGFGINARVEVPGTIRAGERVAL
ncbi:MAG: MOSC domain-containing protein [Actinomycetota bacterium]|nr:MOSC domain-containing protein [Actinomycetota bacterium]